MTARRFASDERTVTQALNCVVVATARRTSRPCGDGGSRLPCIRCGDCAAVCPRGAPAAVPALRAVRLRRTRRDSSARGSPTASSAACLRLRCGRVHPAHGTIVGARRERRLRLDDERRAARGARGATPGTNEGRRRGRGRATASSEEARRRARERDTVTRRFATSGAPHVIAGFSVPRVMYTGARGAPAARDRAGRAVRAGRCPSAGRSRSRRPSRARHSPSRSRGRDSRPFPARRQRARDRRAPRGRHPAAAPLVAHRARHGGRRAARQATPTVDSGTTRSTRRWSATRLLLVSFRGPRMTRWPLRSTRPATAGSNSRGPRCTRSSRDGRQTAHAGTPTPVRPRSMRSAPARPALHDGGDLPRRRRSVRSAAPGPNGTKPRGRSRAASTCSPAGSCAGRFRPACSQDRVAGGRHVTRFDPGAHASATFHLFSGATAPLCLLHRDRPRLGRDQRRGRQIYGAGHRRRHLTIRTWGGYPDGVAFAVLLMNLAGAAHRPLHRARIHDEIRTPPTGHARYVRAGARVGRHRHGRHGRVGARSRATAHRSQLSARSASRDGPRCWPVQYDNDLLGGLDPRFADSRICSATKDSLP